MSFKAIYTRTISVKDHKLGEAMEICNGLAEVRKKHYPTSSCLFFFSNWRQP